jgi:hypothetical protein
MTLDNIKDTHEPVVSFYRNKETKEIQMVWGFGNNLVDGLNGKIVAYLAAFLFKGFIYWAPKNVQEVLEMEMAEHFNACMTGDTDPLNVKEIKDVGDL